ncbi:MAG TPA: cell division protein FtsZ, partial [Methanomassiliicoccales archaeon]|nr:cell division protein FtsZ [Methanomassiliicoccales archaeon]
EALTSPMLGEIELKEAKGALIRVFGGPDMTAPAAQRVAEIVTNSVSPRARIIWGCSIDPELEGVVKVLLIITGAKSKYIIGARGAPVGMQGNQGYQQQQYQQPYQQQQYQQPYQQQRPRNRDDDIDFVR